MYPTIPKVLLLFELSFEEDSERSISTNFFNNNFLLYLQCGNGIQYFHSIMDFLEMTRSLNVNWLKIVDCMNEYYHFTNL